MQQFLARYFFIKVAIISALCTSFAYLPLIFWQMYASLHCGTFYDLCDFGGQLLGFLSIFLLFTSFVFPLLAVLLLLFFFTKSKVKNPFFITISSVVTFIIVYSIFFFPYFGYPYGSDSVGPHLILLIEVVTVLVVVVVLINYFLYTKINEKGFGVRPVIISTLLITLFLLSLFMAKSVFNRIYMGAFISKQIYHLPYVENPISFVKTHMDDPNYFQKPSPSLLQSSNNDAVSGFYPHYQLESVYVGQYTSKVDTRLDACYSILVDSFWHVFWIVDGFSCDVPKDMRNTANTFYGPYRYSPGYFNSKKPIL